MMIANCKRWLLVSAAAWIVGTCAASAQAPAPIYTKNAALRLPIQLDERSRSEVAEIKLYVRGPSGAWECVRTAPSTQTAFDYRAPSDGEYSFTFVTIDRRGNPTPRNVESATPHRLVIVDATAPAVTAAVKADKAGTLLQCQVRDANPDWKTLRAMYLAPGGNWQLLVPASADSPTVFKLPSTAVIENKVRVEISDRAGNRTSQDIDLANPPALPPATARSALDRGRPDPALLTKDVDPVVAPPPPIPDARYEAHPGAAKSPMVDVQAVPPLPDFPDVKAHDLPPDIKMPPAPDIKIPEAPAITSDPSPLKVPSVRPPTDNIKIPEIPDITPPDAKAPLDLPPPVVPASRNSSSAMKPSDLSPIAPTRSEHHAIEKPAGSHPVLNTRTCSINYQLEGGTRLTNRTDFWATADAGRTWSRLQDASHGVPPAKLTLPGDGVYGIRIRPGGGSRPPESGEEPDCIVEVDTTNPAVNLLPPSIGAEDGTMILNWTAADTNLLSNSINLYYSRKKEGPWEVIVSGYKNEGVYRWTLPAKLTGPIYLRLEAMDRAGNIGRVELPDPVPIDPGKQRVKVIGVGPGQWGGNDE